jgi:co-chaperonin GroES (HSP10)
VRVSRLRKKLIVVGDRLLVRPEEGEERTGSGLYLPQTAVSARQAQGGWVVAVGPGIPVPEPVEIGEFPQDDEHTPRYLRLQAQEGDYCVFLKKAAVEINYDKKSRARPRARGFRRRPGRALGRTVTARCLVGGAPSGGRAPRVAIIECSDQNGIPRCGTCS